MSHDRSKDPAPSASTHSPRLRTGDQLSGFTVVDVRELPEFDAYGVLARHDATGAEVFHLVNDDSENLFSFGFKTIPGDSTGVAHILEHSVLCGSQNYPLKDSFIVLAQGSLQTFLNAMTYPDKTLYPASSTNRRDYFNLMAVYGDAVFRPLLSPWIFRQEGWRHEFDDEGKLAINGVVYNEMKGEYSSMESIAGDWIGRSVLPAGPYAYDSGGDPAVIPTLTHEDLVAFHRSHYCPANCRVFLCGDIDTGEQLAFLDEHFFSCLPAGAAVGDIPLEPRWSEGRRFVVPAPSGEESASIAMMSWLIGDSTDADEVLLYTLLAEVLLGHDGSPLYRALVESGIGEDLAPVCGFDATLRESTFSLGLRGVPTKRIDEFDAFVRETLARFVKEGLPKEEIEAAFRGLEFANREIRRSHGPFSLVYLRRAMRAWLHGGHPTDTLCIKERIASLKERLNNEPHLLEGLIQVSMLDNAHCALVEVRPDPDMARSEEERLKKQLSIVQEGLTTAGRERIEEEARDLAAAQTAVETPEQLACIPHLARSDLEPRLESIPVEYRSAGRLPAIVHPVHTNDITYIDLAMPLDLLEPADYAWLPLFTRFMGSLGLPGLDYGEVSSRMARLFGGFHVTAQVSSVPEGTARSLATPAGVFDIVGRDSLICRMKVLDEQVEEATALMHRLVEESLFEDPKRLRDLLAELRNDLDASLSSGGTYYAHERASRRASRARAIEELWGGLTGRNFVRILTDRVLKNSGNTDSSLPPALEGIASLEDVGARLASLRDRIASSGLLVHVTAAPPAVERALDAIANNFTASVPWRPRREELYGEEPWFAFVDGGNPGSEVYFSQTLQTGFSALCLRGGRLGSSEYPAELVLAHYLSTAVLWEEIRMKGGAYGASASCDPGDGLFNLSTYRDPDPARSLATFREALGRLAHQSLPEEVVDKTVIGAFSRETGPRTPSEHAWLEFLRLLFGYHPRYRLKKLQELVTVDAQAVRSAAERVLASASWNRAAASGAGEAPAAIVCGPNLAREAAKRLGFTLRDL